MARKERVLLGLWRALAGRALSRCRLVIWLLAYVVFGTPLWMPRLCNAGSRGIRVCDEAHDKAHDKVNDLLCGT